MTSVERFQAKLVELDQLIESLHATPSDHGAPLAPAAIPESVRPPAVVPESVRPQPAAQSGARGPVDQPSPLSQVDSPIQREMLTSARPISPEEERGRSAHKGKISLWREFQKWVMAKPLGWLRSKLFSDKGK